MLGKIKSKMSGSVLIFTLLMLSIALVAAISLATAVVVGTKSAGDTNKSVQAFQTADSGVEKVLMAIKNNTTDNFSDLGTCSGGNVTGTVHVGDSYAITLYDSEDKEVSCSDTTRKVSEIRKIKSVGKFGGAIRAVETAVAAGNDCGVCGGCMEIRNNVGNTRCGYGQGGYASGSAFYDGVPIPPTKCVGPPSDAHCGCTVGFTIYLTNLVYMSQSDIVSTFCTCIKD